MLQALLPPTHCEFQVQANLAPQSYEHVVQIVGPECKVFAQQEKAKAAHPWLQGIQNPGQGAQAHVPMLRVGQTCMWQPQATESTAYTAHIPYKYSKRYGFGQP